MDKKYKLTLQNISPAIACVYELTPGWNYDKPVLHLFNDDKDAEQFWNEGCNNSTDTDGYWFLYKSHQPKLVPEWDEDCRLNANERIWLLIGHYNGSSVETICTTTWLKKLIAEETAHPFFESMEILRPEDFVISEAF